MTYRVIVAGSRTWDRPLIVAAVLSELRDSHGSALELIYRHSGRGADTIADRWAENHDVTTERWSLRPGEVGTEAEESADRAMVDHKADACVAFIRAGMSYASTCGSAVAELAEAAGIPVTRYFYELPYPELFNFEVYDEERQEMVRV